MTIDFRSLCAELIDALDSGIQSERIRMSPLGKRTRVALAAGSAARTASGSPHRSATTPAGEVGNEDVEAAAQIIYGSMRFDRIDSTLDWAPGGNSFAQDEARRCARAVLARCWDAKLKGANDG